MAEERIGRRVEVDGERGVFLADYDVERLVGAIRAQMWDDWADPDYDTGIAAAALLVREVLE